MITRKSHISDKKMKSVMAACFVILQLAIITTSFAAVSTAATNQKMLNDIAILEKLALSSDPIVSTKDRVSRSSSKDLYLGMCTEEDYEEWYTNEYPVECQQLLGNASTLHMLFGVYCDPFCGGIYFDYLDDCGSTGMVLSSFYTHLCIENERGVPCYYYITSDEYDNPRPEVDEYCFPMNETCTTECYYALESMSIKLGCCVNTLYNQSIPDPVAQYALWENCDLTAPGHCYTELELSGSPCLGNSLNLLSIAVMLLGVVTFK